jgi:hypothetical protein
MDEVFGDESFCCQIAFRKTAAVSSPNAKVNVLGTVTDVILWFAKNIESITYRQLSLRKTLDTDSAAVYSRIQLPNGERRRMTSNELSAETETEGRIYRVDNATSTGFSENLSEDIRLGNYAYSCGLAKHWKTHPEGMRRLLKADRLVPAGKSLGYIRLIDDFAVFPYVNTWMDTGTGSFTDDKMYVVQTGTKTIERCLLMATDPGDLVLGPTCGSGTTAYVAEQWGRRWITIDTSRVALALARARIMGARYLNYLLADSREGQKKEADVTRSAPGTQPVHGNVRLGFVYERVPHITLKAIANNAEIDVIHEKWQATLEPLRAALNKALKRSWEEWEIPREAEAGWPAAAHTAHTEWWEARIARQKEIDAGFDLLVACGFNFEAVATEFSRLGPLPILKARMNADLHMADDLKNTGKGNLFVVFGEPDIELLPAEPAGGSDMLQVKIKGMDVFHPVTGEVRSDNADGIACWFIDTDYDEQSFFVRHANFFNAGDPYAALKTTLKAEIDPEAWESLRSHTSRPFPKPAGGRIAVKAINHLGDEVMKVFRV